MNGPWDEFTSEEREQLVQLSKMILDNEIDLVEGAHSLWSIVLNYDVFQSQELLHLMGIVDEYGSAERGEAHLYSVEMLRRKDEHLTGAIEFYSPMVKDIASKIIEMLVRE